MPPAPFNDDSVTEEQVIEFWFIIGCGTIVTTCIIYFACSCYKYKKQFYKDIKYPPDPPSWMKGAAII